MAIYHTVFPHLKLLYTSGYYQDRYFIRSSVICTIIKYQSKLLTDITKDD